MKKSVLIVGAVILLSLQSIAQDSKIEKFLGSTMAGFTAQAALESKLLDDGATRHSITYEKGEKTWRVRLTSVPNENLEKTNGEVKELIDMFKEMGAAGKMEVEAIDSGVIQFSRGRGGVIVWIEGGYMLEITARGFAELSAVRDMYNKMDLSALK